MGVVVGRRRRGEHQRIIECVWKGWGGENKNENTTKKKKKKTDVDIAFSLFERMYLFFLLVLH